MVLDGMPSGAQHFPDHDDGVNLNVCRCVRCRLVQLDNAPVAYWDETIDTSADSPERAAYMAEQEATWGKLDFLSRHRLEHQPDPMGYLAQYQGRGVVEVPNITGIPPWEFMRDHLLYFDEVTFRRTLEHAGFTVWNLEEVWHGVALSAVVHRKWCAVWSAGHQAMAVMRLWGIRPRYVIDSSPLKIGKTCPVADVEIVAPDRLTTDPPELLYVIASGYNDEVCAQARTLGYKGRMVRFDDGRFSDVLAV